ncbi:MAG: zinc-dependent alcohol dehydrogenase family protein [Planctomycetia bacterium]
MRAYELGQGTGVDALTLVERPDPTPAARQAVVRMSAAALNYRDLLVVRGAYGDRPLHLVPLSDGVGEVVALGTGASRVKIGDRVAGIFMQGWHGGPLDGAKARTALGGAIDGVLAEYVAFDEDGLVQVPGHLTDEEAACLPCAGVTAWHAVVESSRTAPGQSVLIQGTGGVSLFALQFAKAAGAKVYIISSSEEKLGRAVQLGADETFCYRANPGWDDWIFSTTGRVGVDHVVEIGGPGTLARSIRATRMGGVINLIGVLTGNEGEVPTANLLRKGLRLQGIYVGSRDMFEAMNRALAAHEIRPVVDQVHPFEQAADAYRRLESGDHFGKVVVRIG